MPQNTIALVAMPPVVPINQLPVITQPYVPQPVLDFHLKAMANKINELTSQMGELRVYRMDATNKKKQPRDDRADVWYTNYKG